MQRLGKLRRLYLEEGARATFVRVFNFFTPDWLFCAHCGYITRNDLAALPGYSGTEIVRWASAQDLNEIRRFDEYCDDLPGWIARGDLFVVACRDGRIVGFENYQRGQHRFVQTPWVCVDLADDELWAAFSLVDPKYRGKGIVKDLVNFASKRLLHEGYRFVHGHTAKGDASAARAHKKRGFQSIDDWRIYRVFGTTLFRSRLMRRRGRWRKAQPLNLRIRDVSGPPQAAEGESLSQSPSAQGAHPAIRYGAPATIPPNIHPAQVQ